MLYNIIEIIIEKDFINYDKMEKLLSGRSYLFNFVFMYLLFQNRVIGNSSCNKCLVTVFYRNCYSILAEYNYEFLRKTLFHQKTKFKARKKHKKTSVYGIGTTHLAFYSSGCYRFGYS